MTEDEAQEMIAQLAEHYGERVARVSSFCSAMLEWVRVMESSGYAPHVGEAWRSVQLFLIKSNLAYRLVYLGEPLRTEPCPKHKGHWSGCRWDEDLCECASGSNITGWLPPPEGAKPDPHPPLMLVTLDQPLPRDHPSHVLNALDETQ